VLETTTIRVLRVERCGRLALWGVRRRLRGKADGLGRGVCAHSKHRPQAVHEATDEAQIHTEQYHSASEDTDQSDMVRIFPHTLLPAGALTIPAGRDTNTARECYVHAHRPCVVFPHSSAHAWAGEAG
jgi:hypothetical protein